MRVTLVACTGPREVREWALDLPPGAVVRDALQAAGVEGESVGVWGRAVSSDAALRDGDRVETYRPLKVDPKVARRERFARQGARTAGLFNRQRPGGKAGY
ncbi:MAG: RnfH family protein [Acidovorax sp.]|uniref:RnfH family protein n=1 Tax=Acidovorax sp. TaxID=1872122 RepID=UPI0039E29BD6